MYECNDDTDVVKENFVLLLADIEADTDGLRVILLLDETDQYFDNDFIFVNVFFTDGVILTLNVCDEVSLFNGESVVYNVGILVCDILVDELELIVGDTLRKSEFLDDIDILGVVLSVIDTDGEMLRELVLLNDVDVLIVAVFRIEELTESVTEELIEILAELLAELRAELDTDTVCDTLLVTEPNCVLVNEDIGRAVLVNIIRVDVAHRVTELERVEDIEVLTECVFERDLNGETVFDTVPVVVLDTLILLDNDDDAVGVLDCDEERLCVGETLDDFDFNGLDDTVTERVGVFDTLILRDIVVVWVFERLLIFELVLTGVLDVLYVLIDDTVSVGKDEHVGVREDDKDEVRVFSIDSVIFSDRVNDAEVVLEPDILTDLLGVNDPLADLVNDATADKVRDELDEEDTVGLAVDVLLSVDVLLTDLVGLIVFVGLTEKEIVWVCNRDNVDLLDTLELAELVLDLHSVEVPVMVFDRFGVLDTEGDALDVLDTFELTEPVVDNEDVFDTDADRVPELDNVDLLEFIDDTENVTDGDTVADKVLEDDTVTDGFIVLDIAADLVIEEDCLLDFVGLEELEADGDDSIDIDCRPVDTDVRVITYEAVCFFVGTLEYVGLNDRVDVDEGRAGSILLYIGSGYVERTSVKFNKKYSNMNLILYIE